MSIRLASLADVKEIYRLCASFHKASEYELPLDRDYAMRYIESHLQNESSLSLVLLDQDQIVGCLLAISSAHLFLPVLTATELVWWVEPEFRSRSSLQLLDAFEYWATEIKHCDLMCVTSHMEDPRLEVYYKRKKYIPKEIGWYKTTKRLI